MASWHVTLTQRGNTTGFSRKAYNGRTRTALATVCHASDVWQAARTAQRANPGWTVVAAQAVS